MPNMLELVASVICLTLIGQRWAKEAFNRIGLCYRSGDNGCHSMDTEAPMKTRANGEKM